jgi:predicted O-methyltransferase YrrM
LAQKYLHYFLTASNGKGHGIHSPFVYDFIERVLNDTGDFPAYSRIGSLRRQMEKDPAILDIEDLGAGSARHGSETRGSGQAVTGSRRRIGDLARQAAKPKKLGQLLFRIDHHYRPRTILELGTSLGLSTAYLASGSPAAKLLTIEGAGAVAAVAEKNFQSLGLGQVELIVGHFDQAIGGALDRLGPLDLAFVDGNHRREPTLRYFDLLISRASPSSVLIFDDIHWSPEMETAWLAIRQDPRAMLTIDLFFMGLVFLRDEFKVKQDFTLRF